MTGCGGSINVASVIGKGTVFNIYLPVVKVTLLPEKNQLKPPLSRGGERILLVDDEQQLVRIMRQMLESLGYSVTSFTDSLEALAHFKEHPRDFDLILSDLTMPKLIGPELAKRIFELRADAKVIICTGFSERLPKEQVDSLGMKGMLMKPVTVVDLAVAVRKALDE